MRVPRGLHFAFIVHFIVDLLVAIPLFLFPNEVLAYFGWTVVDPISARIVAAALFAVGIKSFIGRHASPEVYRSMIVLKLLWSFFAMAALASALVLGEFGNYYIGLGLFGIFAVFHTIWWYWHFQLKEVGFFERLCNLFR